MNKTTKVLLVDDHKSILDGITAAFEATGEFSVIGQIANADFAEISCEKLNPDLVMLDVRTADGASGLEAAAVLRQKYPQLKIIIFTSYDDVSYIPRVKAAGANGFIHKSESLSEFVEIARKVMAGEDCFPPTKAIPLPNGKAPLTERELELLRLLCAHKSTEEIAKELYISEDTVKYHKKMMLARTGFNKIADLVFYVINNGWINPLY